MYRTASSYALAGMALLALGLLASRFAVLRIEIAWRHTGYLFPYNVFCYGFGAFFCVYAFLASIWLIPSSAMLSRWHFRLSAGSVLLLAAGFAYFAAFVVRHPTETRVGPALLLAIGSVLGGLVVFSMAQLWFAIDFVSALWRLRSAA